MDLGVDLGTSGLEAVLVAGAQAVIRSATAPLTVGRRHPALRAPAD
ncbi:hypothetical protein LRS73_01845 [Methylobacterium currus]|nr:hypothetical protein [Methylobacterium currus]UHC16697.1 hypothetical protein LRS73_01845 [Methylobacterium currus]